MDRTQLYVARCLLKTGISTELIDIILNNCGATKDDWQSFLRKRWVTLSPDKTKYILSKEGKSVYNEFKKEVTF